MEMHFRSSPGAASVSAHLLHSAVSEGACGLGRLCGHSDGLLTGFLCNRSFFVCVCVCSGTIYCFPVLMLCLAEPKSMVKCLIIFSEALH